MIHNAWIANPSPANKAPANVGHFVTAPFTLCAASLRSSPAFVSPAFAWSVLPLFSRSRLQVTLPAASLTRPLASWALFDALSLVLIDCSRSVRGAKGPGSNQRAPRGVTNAATVMKLSRRVDPGLPKHPSIGIVRPGRPLGAGRSAQVLGLGRRPLSFWRVLLLGASHAPVRSSWVGSTRRPY